VIVDVIKLSVLKTKPIHIQKTIWWVCKKHHSLG